MTRRVGRGGAMGANAHPPPPTGRKGPPGRIQRWTYEKTERQRWIFSSNLSTHPALHSVENLPEVVDHLKLCSWYLFDLPRPINSHNTIMRKGRLAVVFLGSIFPKSLKMHSQVKSLLTEPLYLLTLRLFDVFISNNTHRLLVVSTTSCRYRAPK